MSPTAKQRILSSVSFPKEPPEGVERREPSLTAEAAYGDVTVERQQLFFVTIEISRILPEKAAIWRIHATSGKLQPVAM